MTHTDIAVAPSTTLPASYSPSPAESSCATTASSAFALLMAENKELLSTDEDMDLTCQTGMAGMFGDAHKRHQRQLFQRSPGYVMESVNSSKIPSEKRHPPSSIDFSGDKNNEQTCSDQSSTFHHSDSKKGQNVPEQKRLTHGNNESISAHVAAGTQLHTSAIRTSAVAVLLPDAELKKLVRVLRNTSLSKRTSVFLTLDLKEMGEVKLDVRLNGKKISIIAHLADRRAAAALSYAIGELKKKMAEIDLSLESFEFSTVRKGPGSVSAKPSAASVSACIHSGRC